MNKPINILDKDYLQWIKELCKRYRQSRIKAAVKVNTEMLKFYWSLGRDIVALKAEARWGSKFYKNLSKDLKEANPLATYSDLDGQNRVTDANALLNKSLMPTAKREPLTWNPTGWHNKKTAHGWLYNRSHLIGYQLTGENNNPKNLMTGTQTLNTPLMLAHEMDIAYYLKQSTSHYVRYEVKPIFRGNELVARGVQMRAQSIGDNQVYFNVYIFNIEPGYTINYADGTSTKN